MGHGRCARAFIQGISGDAHDFHPRLAEDEGLADDASCGV